MTCYEALLLAIPEVTQDEIQRLESQLTNVIRSQGGAVISFEKWGKYRLAYPVNKNDYGIYFLTRFEIEEASGKLIEEIKSILKVKLQDIVARSIIVKLEPGQSLEYQRPQSLEEAPAREMGSFLSNALSGNRSGRGRMRDDNRPHRSRFEEDRSEVETHQYQNDENENEDEEEDMSDGDVAEHEIELVEK